jgi:hypothetical protein
MASGSKRKATVTYYSAKTKIASTESRKKARIESPTNAPTTSRQGMRLPYYVQVPHHYCPYSQ